MVAAQRTAKPAAQAPVSAHPLFPAIVALWFAALLGIGTMVLPQALFDQIGVATGMGALGFTFRLGLGLVAGLVGALVGVMLARKVASGQVQPKPRKRAPAGDGARATTRKPISALEELGSDGLDDPIEEFEQDAPEPQVHSFSEPLAGRRRSLTVTDESGPSEYMQHVPLPGGEGVLDLIGAEDFPADFIEEGALELGHFDHEEHDTVPDYPRPSEPARPLSPLFSADPFAESDPVDAPPVAMAPAPSAGDGVFRAPQPAPGMTAPFHQNAPFGAPSPAAEAVPPFGMAAVTGHSADQAAPFVPQPQFEQASAPTTAAAPFSAPVSEAHHSTPPSFSAPAFSMPVPSEPAPADRFPAPYQPAPVAQPMFAPAELAQARPAEELASLDTVALVERFARALRQASGSTSATAVAAAQAAPAFVMPQPLAAPPAAPEAAPAAPFGMPATAAPAMIPAHPAAQPAAFQQHEPYQLDATSLPAALAPLSFDEHDDHDESDEHDHPFSLPLAGMAKPFAAAEAPAQPQPFGMPSYSVAEPRSEADSDPEPENEDSFGSLLAMKSGFGAPREFVRVEDDDDDSDGSIEPVVVFPGTAPQGGAMPAPDGPSRDPAQPAPFARPAFVPPAQPAAQPIDRTATEAALRDALARLQQMSGAA